ncbi:MAG: hypothetical protein MUF16_23415 [Burkholderiaceae bacterium]|jgi:hypothetical protein|nr:hypothetical protein [Burkholderiaceae bacterium]
MSTPTPADKPTRDDTIAALRVEIFSALRAVRNGTLDIDRAKQINALASTLIDSARVEVQYLQTMPDAGRSDFLDNDQAARLPPGITGVTVHRLKG